MVSTDDLSYFVERALFHQTNNHAVRVLSGEVGVELLHRLAV